MSWQDILKGPKYNAAMREVRELEGKLQAANQKMERAARSENVSRAGQRGTTSKPEPTQEEPAQEETSDENLPQKITEDMDEDTQKKIRMREGKKRDKMSRQEIAEAARAKLTEDKESKKKPGRIAEPKPTFRERMARRKEAQTPEATKERMARRKSSLLGGEKAKERRRKIYSKGKDWKDALQRRRQEISESGPSPGDRREEARHAKQAEERKKRRAKTEEDKVIREEARQSRIQATKDKKAEQARLDELAREERVRRARERSEQIASQGPIAQPGRPSSKPTPTKEVNYAKTKMGRRLKLEDEQRARAEAKKQQQKTEQVTDKLETQVLPKVEQALQNTVNKMNNDKYNAEQKSEPNKNFTPFVPLEKKRVMPEKQNKIPGVIQHSRPKRKKTENKW